MKLNEEQQEAVARAAAERFLIVNGAAGCGKTCVIKNIADAIGQTGGDVRLCAFAGKAAARIREATGYPSATIHSMLRFDGTRFLCSSLEGLTVIIDEASMVSSSLLAAICKRNPKRLVLVGDEAQLPPVGLGQPFHDLIALNPSKVVTLKKCYRNSEAIYAAAMRVREGRMPERVAESANEKWVMKGLASPQDVHMAVLDMVRRGELDFERDIILVPRNADETNDAASVKSLNRDILDLVNPHGANERFKAGDRIINTKNHPELDIWNGTTATVLAVEDAPKGRGRVYLHLDYPAVDAEGNQTQDIHVTYDVAKGFMNAYALTVHKSQGSQYRKVVFICLARDSYALLNRSMIYTAVTRAKSECIILGELPAFAGALGCKASKRTVMQMLARMEA